MTQEYVAWAYEDRKHKSTFCISTLLKADKIITNPVNQGFTPPFVIFFYN